MEEMYYKYFLPLDSSLLFSSAVKQPGYLPYFLVCKNSMPCTQEEMTDFLQWSAQHKCTFFKPLRIALIYSILTQHLTKVSV